MKQFSKNWKVNTHFGYLCLVHLCSTAEDRTASVDGCRAQEGSRAGPGPRKDVERRPRFPGGVLAQPERWCDMGQGAGAPEGGRRREDGGRQGQGVDIM